MAIGKGVRMLLHEHDQPMQNEEDRVRPRPVSRLG
jgi:hypothetical protein